MLSRFAHIFDLNDSVAMYHSLRMKPVYLRKEKYEELTRSLASSSYLQSDDIPPSIANEVQELIKYKILTQTEDEDDRVLKYVQSKIPIPAVNVCYMILSEQCNLTCKYCFLGNNDLHKRELFSSESMSTKVADKALDFFIRQINESGCISDDNKPILIFYGGEPLINFRVLEYIATKVNELREQNNCIKNIEMSIITNGVLLDHEKLVRLKELGVAIAISVDGFTEQSNKMRIDRAGNPVFPQILNVLNQCKDLDIDISLSVTLSEETIKDTQNVLELIDSYGIKGFGFNIMMSDENFVLSQEYNENAAQFIIDSFVELRKRGVYEDRMMRKLKSFTKAQVYFSDCAATAGGQIVVAPDGSVGICHGCLSDKKYFVSDVNDDTFKAEKNQAFIEWSQLTPVNRDECLSCSALGICGGGCPINAMNLNEGNTIHSLDERFCVHSKKTLEFLIRDLYRIITEGGEQ